MPTGKSTWPFALVTCSVLIQLSVPSHYIPNIMYILPSFISIKRIMKSALAILVFFFFSFLFIFYLSLAKLDKTKSYIQTVFSISFVKFHTVFEFG